MMKFGSDFNLLNKRSIERAVCLALLFAVSFCLLFPVVASAEGFFPPEQIVLTWTADPTRTQAITWLMPPDSSAAVQYLRAEDFSGDFGTARQLGVYGAAFSTDASLYRYTRNLIGLNPDTEYIYRVGSDGCWGEPASFTTAAETESFAFLYMGDIQAGYADWGNMLSSVYGTHPEIKFALLGGDLTDNGSDEGEWGEFLDAAAGVFSRIPMMPARGNHDGRLFEKFFALPDNGPRGVTETFYSFDYGDAHFVILDTSNIITENVKQWLTEDLQGSDKRWKFAVFHKPAYPVVYDYKGIDLAIREHWVPILEENGVDMVFVGHQHVYMRTHPIYQGEIADDDSYGIVYVMGNAGSKHYLAGQGFSYVACERTGSNYQVIELDGGLLTLTSREADGELIESYTIDKRPQVQPQKPKYNIIPGEDPAYSTGATAEGIKTMIVNPGQSGLKYFSVLIEPIISHEGTETVVFTQFRNGAQVQLNALVADFDLAGAAQAGFNVKEGDIIKAYLVDELSNALDFNPTVLH